jgi:GTPase SAR1 family protein
MQKITKYFRSAVVASSQGTIDYVKDGFSTISSKELEDGMLGDEIIKFLWKKTDESEADNLEENTKQCQDAIIALKTVSTEFVDLSNSEIELEEMTSVLFLPVKVNENGALLQPEEGKVPWIPREYLLPMEEPQIAIGNVDHYDTFLETTTDQRNQIDSWERYLCYAKDLFKGVTNSEFLDEYILCGNEKIKTDGKYYIFLDKTVNATYHILQLYNHLLKNVENKLYLKLTNGKTENTKPLYKNSNIIKMKDHVGQMGGEYALSPSQREAMNHFNEINEGDILAVNGPPGTGKTTLLQSIVANMYVNCALREDEAPIIVASSTNNQAVTNIIDSFGKINKVRQDNLEHRWITGVNSFATYFPSKGKVNEAIRNHYQYTNVNGEAFAEDIETQENRESAKKLFELEYKKYFDNSDSELLTCKNKLLQELHNVNAIRVECLSKIERIKNVIQEERYDSFVLKIDEQIIDILREEEIIGEKIEKSKEKNRKYLERCSVWRTEYDTLPWYIRFFKFIAYFNNKILNWSYSFIEDDELGFLKRDMRIEEIETIYRKKIDENDQNIYRLIEEKKCKKEKRLLLEKEKQKIENMLCEMKSQFKELSKYKILLPENKEKAFWDEFDICKINNFFDQVRYLEFWLAVHYYESRWLIEKNPIKEKQKGKTFEGVLDKLYHRLAMVSPCMVMTFFMLPKQFLAYNSNDKSHYYLYNYIDLLIVDEAGQISPEIAAPSFSLAKKAVVVGDEQQIPPVWGTVRALDIAMAMSNNVIGSKDEYSIIEENGLNCSQSSIMKISSLSCAYDKYGKGLFLSEHRRCYNEIVDYCNELVYGGNLEPLRGSANGDNENVLVGYLPAMGHKEITVGRSQKIGCSRRNEEEAKAIVFWLKENYLKILEKYQIQAKAKKNELNHKEVVGIVTPFKNQAMLLRKIIKQEIPEWVDDIAVGTVHTFQGAERKVIIFSSVYGSEEGCFFINNNKSLMNVAVSRAKDSFLVFGDSTCLTGGKKSAGGLLKEMTVNEILY